MKALIIIWLLVVSVMCFVPPWQERCNNSMSGFRIDTTRARGYSSVFNPPEALYFKPEYATISISKSRLFLPLVGVTALAGALAILFANCQADN